MNIFEQDLNQIYDETPFASPFCELDSFALASYDEKSKELNTETGTDKEKEPEAQVVEKKPIRTIKNRTGRKKQGKRRGAKLTRDLEKRERDKERARNNRIRKKQYIESLENRIKELEAENRRMRDQMVFPY